MKARAVVYNADGYTCPIEPENGADFSLDEMRQIVGGTIDIQPLPKDGKLMVLNDSGKLDGLRENKEATRIWKRNYPVSEYPYNNDELVVGNVLVCDSKMVR
jgi:uncharacterized protein DUF3846